MGILGTGVGAARYRADGILFPIDVFTPEEIAAYRAAFDRFEQAEGRDRPQERNRARHHDQEFAWRLATDPRLLDVMRQLIGPDLVILGTDFFCKYGDPSADKFVAWHQDTTYWGLEPPVAHTAWIAIDDSTIENGCMRAIPGSNHGGLVTHGESERAGNILSVNQEIPDELVDSFGAVDVVLRAGQISIHDGHIFHSSNANRSTSRRCGMTVRFVTPDVRMVTERSELRPVLVAGSGEGTSLPLADPPFALSA